MHAAKQCPTCGKSIPPDAPGGHCPTCLLDLVGRSDTELDSWLSAGFETTERRFGDYVLGRQIGAGGMGIVYEAHRTNEDRTVAIKVLRDTFGASPVLLCRFTIETEAAARLNHPNIVRVHEVGECHGHPYFSMDLIAGESLGTKIAKGEFPFDWKRADVSQVANRRRLEAIARLMCKVARAVQHAHERGVLHRDLKPGNILIDKAGEPHLTDFGLAKIVQTEVEERRPNLTTPTNLPGTPNYMSPEQASGLEATRASDIYGLGAILYELLAGQPPFGGATPLETFKQIAEHLPISPRRLNPAVCRNLETICLKCLEKDPRHRFISAETMAEDLENWLEKRAIKARPPSLVRQIRRWTERNAIGTALILSLCLGLSISLGLLKKVNDQRKEIEADRDQTFNEGIMKTTLIWDEQEAVTISARELAIMANRSATEVSKASVQLSLGISTVAKPANIAQRYARLLGQLQEEMGKEMGERVAFDLKLFKRLKQDEVSLATAQVDVMMLSAVDYLKAKHLANGVVPIAREQNIREVILFANTNSGIQNLTDLAGKSVAFPDPVLSMTVWAKAHLAGSNILWKDLRFCTNLIDIEAKDGVSILSVPETMNLVLRGQVDAGTTYRKRFELNKHSGLVMLDRFPDTPNVLAAREGLDPRIIEALRKVVHLIQGKPGYDNVSVDMPSEMAATEDSYFDALRQAIREAERFDGKSNARD